MAVQGRAGSVEIPSIRSMGGENTDCKNHVISQSLLVIMHNSGTIISKTGVRYQVNGQMVVDEAVDHLWEPENLKPKK